MRHAATQGRSGPYQLMAAIHASHTARMETGVTAWGDVVALYNMLLAVRPSAVAEVNRAVAPGEAEEPEAGLAALTAFGEQERLASWRPGCPIRPPAPGSTLWPAARPAPRRPWAPP